MANRLEHASSPYLRQHAGNPVDWREWGPEAFAEARERDVPVFLSVGYSACHWCHVMARESFSDPDVAGVLNAGFVPVKVDREERPDVDRVYMGAVQAITGQGGWPMSVFVDPDGTPFFGGTYWPREDRGGMPGFLGVLAAVTDAWTRRRADLADTGARLVAHLAAAGDAGRSDGGGGFDAAVAGQAADALVRSWDRALGGFGGAPKFPQAMALDFLLAHHLRTGDTGALHAALQTLDAMSRGGICDHAGGGFARYATDAAWRVPHFEKMLYDNALLLRAYVHSWQVTGQPRMARIARETAEAILRDFGQDAGGFSSATNAEAGGVEGASFVWTSEEFDAVVAAAGEEPAHWRRFYGVADEGNWQDPHGHAPERANILYEARAYDEDDPDVAAGRDRVRAALLERRDTRVQPDLDDKVLTSWNALAIAALSEGGAVLGEPRWVDAARRGATFLRDTLVVEGRLQHTWSPGHDASVPGLLEDVGGLARALLVLWEADPDPAWVGWAAELVVQAEEHHADGSGGYWATAADAEALRVRPRDDWDDATPSGTAMLVEAHLRLAGLTGVEAHRETAQAALDALAPRLARAPQGCGELLRSGERLLAGSLEVALVGPDPAPLLAVVRERWLPHAVLAVGSGEDGAAAVPLLEQRPARGGLATAYVCRGFACDAPTADPDELRAQLAAATGRS